MRAIVCGDRAWTDQAMIERVLSELLAEHPDLVVIEGECEGADLLARAAAERLGIPVEPYPADWQPEDLEEFPAWRIGTRADGTRYDKLAGPERNQEMLAAHPGLVLAFHHNLRDSKGTKDMVRRAEKASVLVKVYPFDHRTVQGDLFA